MPVLAGIVLHRGTTRQRNPHGWMATMLPMNLLVVKTQISLSSFVLGHVDSGDGAMGRAGSINIRALRKKNFHGPSSPIKTIVDELNEKDFSI